MNHVCTQAGVLTLNMYGYFNALAIMAAVLIWARVLHMRLQHALIYDPLTVFHNSTEDMDANEVTGLPCCLTNLCHLDYLTTMLKPNLAPYYLATILGHMCCHLYETLPCYFSHHLSTSARPHPPLFHIHTRLPSLFSVRITSLPCRWPRSTAPWTRTATSR